MTIIKIIFIRIKIWKLNVNILLFESLAGCVRERKRFQKGMKQSSTITASRSRKEAKTNEQINRFFGSTNRAKSNHGAANGRKGALDP